VKTAQNCWKIAQSGTSGSGITRTATGLFWPFAITPFIAAREGSRHPTVLFVKGSGIFVGEKVGELGGESVGVVAA
jgi:hypothetical protein